MNIGSMFNSSLYSLKQAMGMANLQKAMNQDAASLTILLKDMETTNAKTLEMSIQPHKGANLDIKL